MKVVLVNCSNCGAPMKFVDGRDYFVCEFCTAFHFNKPDQRPVSSVRRPCRVVIRVASRTKIEATTAEGVLCDMQGSLFRNGLRIGLGRFSGLRVFLVFATASREGNRQNRGYREGNQAPCRESLTHFAEEISKVRVIQDDLRF